MLLTGKYFVSGIEHGRKAINLGHHAVQAKFHAGFNAGDPCPAQPDHAEAVIGLFCSPGSALISGPQGIDHYSREERLFAGRLMRHGFDETGTYGPAPRRKVTDSLPRGPLTGYSAVPGGINQSG